MIDLYLLTSIVGMVITILALAITTLLLIDDHVSNKNKDIIKSIRKYINNESVHHKFSLYNNSFIDVDLLNIYLDRLEKMIK